MGNTKVTAAVVAAQAGVSKWTVIRAFSSEAHIADQTRKRVLEVARALNYQPNLLARSLATNRTHQVAILIDDFSNPYMLPTLGCLCARLQEEGILGVVLNINDSLGHIGAIQNARQRQMDAIVSFGVSFSPKTVTEEMAIASDTPIFVLAREAVSDALPSVYTDAGESLAAMVGHLAARNYCRPVFISGPRPDSTALGRRRHYTRLWQDHGVAPLPEISAGTYQLEEARRMLSEQFRNQIIHERYDVLLCENDILAIAALDLAKHELGLSVPGDLAVVGFDDIMLAATRAYQLTTIRQPYERMVDALVDMIQGNRQAQSVALAGELIIRSTT